MSIEFSLFLIASLTFYLAYRLLKNTSRNKKIVISLIISIIITEFAFMLPDIIFITKQSIVIASKNTPEKRTKIEQELKNLFIKQNIPDIYIEISGTSYDEILLESPVFSEQVINNLLSETDMSLILKDHGFNKIRFYNNDNHFCLVQLL